MTTPLSHLLKGVLKKYGLEKAMVKEQMPRHWAELVGPRVAGISEVRSFEDGILRIHVRESAWRSELILRREELRRQLNNTIGEEAVAEIIFR
jgi:predicted nucleic acid-binding Zn ribbon protein